MFEVPELAVPRLDNVLKKTYHRTKDFFIIAFPILLVTSLVLELLMVYGLLDQIVEPLGFITEGLLGLPPITMIALLFGILRKEMALQLLVVLFGTSDFATVMSTAAILRFRSGHGDLHPLRVRDQRTSSRSSGPRTPPR